MSELAYLNGKIMPLEEAMVPIEDRGYQFGDAVYEYIASYKGRLFRTGMHLDRLEKSLKALNFPSISRNKMRKEIVRLFEAAQTPRAAIYIQISRGVAARYHGFSSDLALQTVMTIKPIPDTHEYVDQGASAITIEDFRWGRCDIKTVQLLPNVLAKQKALDEGTYDAIFITPEGVVREATSSNLFIIKDGIAVTHPLTLNILPGITRAVIMDACRDLKIPVEERTFDVDEMLGAEEVFLTGSTTEVLPINKIDGRQIADGSVGTTTGTLYRELRRRAEGD
jgi:D-alanine transaminase